MKNNNSSYKVIITGGGTGGHVFPAISIGIALKKIIPNVEILFVGAIGKLEMTKVPSAGFNIVGLPMSGLHRRLTLKNLLFPFKLLKCIFMAKRIIKKFKPDVVVGVGGYASWPVARAAISKRIPVLIQEQNSFPGLVNRLLAKKANKICVAYQNMEKYFPKEKIYLTGNPVRQEIKNISNKKEEGINFFNLSKDKPILLVVGGSLGATNINLAIQNALPIFKTHEIQVIWQTGINFYDNAQESVKGYVNSGFIATKFIDRMDMAYAAADIIVSRAGAIAVSELCLVNKPVILIPSPNVAEDHQTKNALSLSDANAAIILEDKFAIEKLGKTVVDLFLDNDKRNKLQLEINRLGFENADESIVYEIVGLLK